MRRLAWLVAGLGAASAVAPRLLRRRRGGGPAPEPPVDPRAEELRRKLADSRPLVDERDEFEGGETTVDAAEPVLEDVGERRRRVHEEARAAAERMRQTPDG